MHKKPIEVRSPSPRSSNTARKRTPKSRRLWLCPPLALGPKSRSPRRASDPPAQTYLEFARSSRSKAELQPARHRLVRGIATCRKRYVALRLDWVVREHRRKWRNRRFAGADRRRVDLRI
jgi:hypothetical protein